LSFALYLDVAGCVRAIDGAFSFGGNVKGRSLLWSAAMLIIVAGALASMNAQTARDRHVVVISIDGFPAFSWNDPLLAVPTLRKLAREGAQAEAMIPVNPTVTWPNHTAMVTGVRPERHSVLYNGWAVRGGEGERLRTEAHVPKVDLVKGTTVYDLAHQAGLTTAEVDWVAIENAPTITYAFTEYSNPEGAMTAEELVAFKKAPITFRDEIWTRAGEHIIKAHKPNLLLFHLLTTDSSQHRYGARSLGGDTALSHADAKVARLVEACRQAGILDKTTFVIVSDHGFKTVKRTIRANAMLKAKGLDGSAWVIPEGGTAMVYATRAADKAKTIAAMKELFTGAEGIAQVLTPAEFPPLGYPSPDANPRMADLVLAAADGFGFDGATEGAAVADVPAGASPGSHGYLNSDPDMRAIFIAWGAGIKPGAKLGVIENLSVGPTVARLLGLEMKDVTGKPLVDILR
jgi:predicted AlkP superfamily pyrophosphatase or phosphodiesterase